MNDTRADCPHCEGSGKCPGCDGNGSRTERALEADDVKMFALAAGMVFLLALLGRFLR